MNGTKVTPLPHAVKHGRYVAATPEAQAEMERQIGRNLYRRGRRITDCTTDDMKAGYLAAENAGEDAFYAEMMRDGAAKFVNWNSGAN